MLNWKAKDVAWGSFPMQNNLTSFDRANEVFLTLTNESYTDGEYIYNTCSIDHRTKDLSYKVNWHPKLKVHRCDKNQYVNVRGRKIYINDEMMKK